jgi:hypothetical protein
VDELVGALAEEDQALVECVDLSKLFIKYHEFFHKHMGVKFHTTVEDITNTFKISRIKEDDFIETHSKICMVWSLTNGVVNILQRDFNMNSGDVLIFPNTWLHAARSRNKMIFVVPFKE